MRNSLVRSALLVSIVIFIGVTSAVAQSSRKLASTPKSFQVFYRKFAAAVERRDRNTVAAMTKFPFKYAWDAEDEGTYTRAQFMAKFGQMFGGTRKLFTRKDPTFYVENGSFTLTNEDDASHYTFSRSGTTYKFRSFMSEP